MDMTELIRAAQGDAVMTEILQELERGDITAAEALQQLIAAHEKKNTLSPVLAFPPQVGPTTNLTIPSPVGGLPRMNPLVEAALIERSQFDGDIPEMRTGPLLPGIMPAIPVQTEARNPVALGHILARASQDIRDKIDQHEKKRLELVAAALTQEALPVILKHGDVIARVEDTDIPALVKGSSDTDIPEYQRGKVPVPVSTTAPSGSELATMSPEDQRTAAWTALSTTHGRRSAVPIVARLAQRLLEGLGCFVQLGAIQETPDVEVSWVLDLSSKGATQPAFAFIDTAARALVAKVKGQIPNLDGQHVTLMVIPVNNLADRQVGWTLRLFKGK